VPMGLCGRVMAVLLDFRLNFRYLLENQFTKFRPEIFLIDSSNDFLNILQVSVERMFLCRDIEFPSILDFCDMPVANDYFLDIQYLDKGTFFSAKT
jgi:hypothetical protein